MRFWRQILILTGITLLFASIVYVSISPYYRFATSTVGLDLQSILFDGESYKSDEAIVNILLLGLPDEANEGPNLTDSIMVVRINQDKNEILTLSIPRDLWSVSLQDKVNSAFAYGEAKKQGTGKLLAKVEIERIINIPIHYTASIKFDALKEIVDTLGGIEVEVENTFVDTKYPVKGMEAAVCSDYEYDTSCRYTTISFDKGIQIMNGNDILTFVRSRNAENEEGSDLARSRRQQIVISAIQDRLIEAVKDGDLELITNVYTVLNRSVDRDITNNEAAQIAKKLFFNGEITQKKVQIPREILDVPNPSQYDGKFVFIPKDKDQFDTVVSCLLTEGDNSTCLANTTSALTQ